MAADEAIPALPAPAANICGPKSGGLPLLLPITVNLGKGKSTPYYSADQMNAFASDTYKTMSRTLRMISDDIANKALPSLRGARKQDDLTSVPMPMSEIYSLSFDPAAASYEHALAVGGVTVKKVLSPGGGRKVTIDFTQSVTPDLLPNGCSISAGIDAEGKLYTKVESHKNDLRTVKNTEFRFFAEFTLPPSMSGDELALPTYQELIASLKAPDILTNPVYDIYTHISGTPVPDHIKAYLPKMNVKDIEQAKLLADQALMDAREASQRCSEIEKLGQSYLNYIRFVVDGVDQHTQRVAMLKVAGGLGSGLKSETVAQGKAELEAGIQKIVKEYLLHVPLYNQRYQKE